MTTGLEGFWGFSDEFGWFRAPLPETPDHPAMDQRAGVPIPPYVLAHPIGSGSVEVMLCDGDGYRACRNRGARPDPEAEWIYADSEDLPEVWRSPLASALETIRGHWPHLTVRSRPDLLD
jgi:hypothetical protein